MSQQNIAAICGVTRTAVTQWESGETKSLKLENFFALCDKAFYCEPRDLMFGNEAAEQAEAETSSYVAAIWDRVPIPLRRLALGLILYSCPHLDRRKTVRE